MRNKKEGRKAGWEAARQDSEATESEQGDVLKKINMSKIDAMPCQWRLKASKL